MGGRLERAAAPASRQRDNFPQKKYEISFFFFCLRETNRRDVLSRPGPALDFEPRALSREELAAALRDSRRPVSRVASVVFSIVSRVSVSNVVTMECF